MALFFSSDIHQGDERFRVHSRGKQCAFMSLSALLTARNIPLNLWSRITFKNALLQGDKMFLNALSSGLIILNPAVEFLSVENSPTVVNVACCTNLLNDFSYEIGQTPIQAKTTVSPMRVTNTTSPMRVTDKTSPMRVTNTTSPMRVTDTTTPMRVTNTTSPMKVTDTTSPMRVTDTDLPIVVEPIEAKTIIDLPIVVEPTEAQSMIDMPNYAENENQICLINYGAEFQGLIITDREIECHYYDIHTALLNTFIHDSYAIVILEGYMMAIVKQRDNFFLFDSHACS